MSQIIPMRKEQVKDQGKSELDYFVQDGSHSNLVDYSDLKKMIQVAENFICVASTSEINPSILELISKYKATDVRLYIVLHSFEQSNKTLNYFDEKEPAILRQSPDLNNNFMIADNKALLFINAFENPKNLSIALTPEEVEDVHYMFNDYFWNKADKEKFMGEIAAPKASPYPPFSKTLEHIFEVKDISNNYTCCLVPLDSQYREKRTDRGEDFYCSEDIQVPIFIHEDASSIGAIQIQQNIFKTVGNRWILKTGALKDIDSSLKILAFEESWDSQLFIQERVKEELESVVAETIESMTDTLPTHFPERKYAQLIEYTWRVLPPVKPKGAKIARIYETFDKLESKFKEDYIQLRRVLDEVKDIQNPWSSFFQGAKQKVKEYEKKLDKYINYDFRNKSFGELEDFFRVEFKQCFEGILSFSDQHKVDLDKKEQEENWKAEKNKKESSLLSKQSELTKLLSMMAENTKLQSKVKTLDTEIKELEKNKSTDEEIKEYLDLIKKERKVTYEQTSSDKKNKQNKGKLERDIKSLQQDIERKYDHFSYTPSQNELSHLKKRKAVQWSSYNLPEYVLPEVGELLEDKLLYYLAIKSYSELEKANELAYKRYLKGIKVAKVVVSEVEVL